MSTDFENELRDLLREKAGETPVATPAAAPQQVLRRGRRRQAATILGSAAVALILTVGSVAGLQRILGDRPDPFQAGGYEVFERTATIEAFTLGSPSNWFLVNEWPLATQMAVSVEGNAAGACVPPPGTSPGQCEETTGDPVSSPIPQPYGLPMLQLSNLDLGLGHIACRDGLPNDAAALYIALDPGGALAPDGATLGPYPIGPGLPPPADAGPCGPGTYAHFTVNGTPMFFWIGVGGGSTDEDRATVMRTAEMMYADDHWEPTQPDQLSPAYVVAGGFDEIGNDWRLELRPGNTNVELSLEGVDPGGSVSDFTVPAVPIESCCEYEGGFTSVAFGAISKAVTRVEFQPADGRPSIPGRIVPLPPSLLFDFDLFFIEGTEGLGGQVVALGMDQAPTTAPPPTAGPRDDIVELSGTFEGKPWSVRFTGAFEDGSACLHVTIDETYEHCPGGADFEAWMDGPPSLESWLVPELYLSTGSVPTEVVKIRFVSDDDAIVPQQFRCEMGPLGWTYPDRKACAIALPSAGSGTLEYVGASGNVLFEEGIAWGVAVPEGEVPTPANPVHGGRYWAVYPWVGAAGSPEADDVSAQLLSEFGIEAFPGDLSCDDGAAEALGTNAPQGIGIYFETEEDANAFALQAGLLDHTDPVIARVTTYCLD